MTDLKKLAEKAKTNCRRIFSDVPDNVFTAPAGFILLGDHTHYTESILIGCALNTYSAIILNKRIDTKINLLISNGPVSSFDVSILPAAEKHFNTSLLIEVLREIMKHRKLEYGFDCYIEHNVPLCIGLGYYSSLIMGLIESLNDKMNFELRNTEKVEIGYNAWKIKIGKIANKATLQCSLLAKENSLLYSDLRKDEPEHVPFDNDNCRFMIFDTREEIINPRDICNERIEECEIGVKGLKLYLWGIRNLRDIKPEFLAKHIHMIPRRVYNKCLYNVNERLRVESSREFLVKNKMQEFCGNIFQSHADLSTYYELSNEKLDFLVNAANESGLVKGAKMISCSSFRSVFSMMEKNEVANVVEILNKKYSDKFGAELTTHEFQICKGMHFDK